MHESFFVFVGFGLAGVLAVMVFMTQRQVSSLKALLMEAAKRFELGKKNLDKLEADLKEARDKMEGDRVNHLKLNTNLEESRIKYAAQTRDIILLKSQYENEKRKLATTVEHLNEQVRTLTSQLAEADAARADALALANKRVEEDQKRVRASQAESQLKKAQEELVAARKLAREQQDELERARAVLKKYDPMEFKKLRQRVTSLEQLFLSMRGLKEMAEERADNWEVALRKMAAHIVGGGARATAPIGPLVGAALEKIGEELIHHDPKDEEHALAVAMGTTPPPAAPTVTDLN